MRRPEAEEQVLVRRLRAVLPAHHVGAHLLERVLGLDHVPPRAVHLAAALVEHLLVAEHAPERRPAGEHDRHEELRVEPEPDLLAHLRDPVGGEPLLPVGVIGEVGRGEALRGARRVAVLDPRRVLPAERRERDDPGVEPDVADLLHPLDRLAALLAGDRHAVDPRPAELLELVEPGEGAALELRARADHVQVPARARVERQRQAVVAAARDVPVAHVAQPVVHALAHVLGHPGDRRVRVEQRLPQVVDRDQPVVGDPEDQRRVAAPAVRVAVLVELRLDEEATLGEVAGDLVGGLGGAEAVQPAVVVVEVAALVDRRQHGQAVHARELEVLAAAARRDVDEPGAFVERDLVPRDDAMLDPRARRQRVERAGVGPADERRAGKPLDERLVRDSGRRRPTRRSRGGRTRPPGARRRRRSRAASTGSSSRRRATRRAGRSPAGARRATGRRDPGRRPTATARAARATCRSAGTIRSSGGPSRASRARAPSSASARRTRCSCR